MNKKVIILLALIFSIIVFSFQNYVYANAIIFSLVPYSLQLVHLLILLVICIEMLLLYKLLNTSWIRAILASFTVNICSVLLGFYLIGAYNYSLEGKVEFGKVNFMQGTLNDLILFLPAWVITVIIEFLLFLKFFLKGYKGKIILMTSIKINTISYIILMVYYVLNVVLI